MRLLQFWRDLRVSFWFLPALCVLGAIALAMGAVWIDRAWEPAWINDWPLVFGSGASGARSLLSTVASSVITIAGVVFSITIVALSLTSAQYSPRVLRNFMSDRGNQAVLGVFVGIFAYCLIVLRTIRGGDEDPFISPIAVLGAVFLAFVGIGVLIYFIHHISVSIQAAHILAAVAGETTATVERLFPKEFGPATDEPAPEPKGAGREAHPIAAQTTGYLQSMDTDRLIAFAAKRQSTVRIEYEIGEFVIAGAVLASITAESKPEACDADELRSLVAIGSQRTTEGDVGFGIRQIVDVALKALSPGINDTTTAVMCVSYLTAILAELSVRCIETRYCDEDGAVRLLTSGPTYEGFVAEAFDQIRQNASGNVGVLAALVRGLDTLARRTVSSEQRSVLREHAEALEEACHRTVPAPRDKAMLARKLKSVQELLGG